jgi:hypothetical protein
MAQIIHTPPAPPKAPELPDYQKQQHAVVEMADEQAKQGIDATVQAQAAATGEDPAKIAAGRGDMKTADVATGGNKTGMPTKIERQAALDAELANLPDAVKSGKYDDAKYVISSMREHFGADVFNSNAERKVNTIFKDNMPRG